jgi:hypothetical protein
MELEKYEKAVAIHEKFKKKEGGCKECLHYRAYEGGIAGIKEGCEYYPNTGKVKLKDLNPDGLCVSFTPKTFLVKVSERVGVPLPVVYGAVAVVGLGIGRALMILLGVILNLIGG